jgi:transcriptional regulator with XRE-family HTH domain
MCKKPASPSSRRPHGLGVQSADWMARLLDQLVSAITKSDRTPYDIARAAGVSKSQVYRLLNGNRGISVETLERLCAELGIDIVLRKKRARKQ